MELQGAESEHYYPSTIQRMQQLKSGIYTCTCNNRQQEKVTKHVYATTVSSKVKADHTEDEVQ